MTPLPTLAASPPTPAVRRRRTWPALLALVWLAPAVGELISGSTGPLLFIQPFALFALPALYGAWAVLIHEVVVRRGLSWGNVLLLGAAFGVFQEGLVDQTFFTYNVPGSPTHDLGSYSAALGINWLWAVVLMAYHAIISIATPLILVRLFFPERALRPWLGVKGAVTIVAWMVLICGGLTVHTTFTQFASQGYHGPPVGSYLLAVGLLVALILVGSFVRFPAPRPHPDRAAPRLWVVRLSVAGWLVAIFVVIQAFLSKTPVPGVVTVALALLIVGGALWRVATWTARRGWGARHWLALAMGVVAYFTFVFGPLVEFAVRLPMREGLTAVDLLIYLALCLYARRLQMREGRAEMERG